MPVIFGSFETSLRGQDSPRPDRRLHKGCSGHLHGAGVKKERASRTPEFKFSKSCCHDEKSDNSSSDEGTTSRPERRSQSIGDEKDGVRKEGRRSLTSRVS